MSCFFVTGTDTDVGKTYVSHLLLDHARAQKLTTLGLKPIAAGCELDPSGNLVNGDALSLIKGSSVALKYELHNPVALAPPIAPHIAAAEAGITLDHAMLERWLTECQSRYGVDLTRCADLVLIEGAGGWMLPLNNQQYLSDWVLAHDWPIILVVGMKLGCLNHTMLTVETIKQQGGKLAGWVANQVDPEMSRYQENLAFLRERIDAPMLAEVGYNQTNASFDLSRLLRCSSCSDAQVIVSSDNNASN